MHLLIFAVKSFFSDRFTFFELVQSTGSLDLFPFFPRHYPFVQFSFQFFLLKFSNFENSLFHYIEEIFEFSACRCFACRGLFIDCNLEFFLSLCSGTFVLIFLILCPSITLSALKFANFL